MTPPVGLDIRPADWAILADILRRHIPDRTVWAFGSRVTGTARPFSDLDLAVLGTTPLSLDQRAALAEALSESDLPFKVDLVDWAETDETFRAIIRRRHLPVNDGLATIRARIAEADADPRPSLTEEDVDRYFAARTSR